MELEASSKAHLKEKNTIHSNKMKLSTMDVSATTALLMLCFVAKCVSTFGMVDYNDECEFEVTDYSTFQTRFDQSKFCDTARGLYCVPGLGKCGCYVPHTIYRAGKCRAKIGNSCFAPGNVRLDCVEHARCTNNNTSSQTFKCQCIKGYLSNAMQTACFPVGYYDRRNSAYGYRSRYYDNNQYWNSGALQFSNLWMRVLIGICTSIGVLSQMSTY